MSEQKTVAYAVVRGEDPVVFLAETPEVLSRLLALKLVARTPARRFASVDRLEEVRQALLEERWSDAVVAWMETVDEVVDVYPAENVHTTAEIDEVISSFEIRMAPVFRDVSDG